MTRVTISLRAAVPSDREAVVEFIHQLNVFETALTGDRRVDYGAARSYYGELQQRISRNGGRIVLALAERQVVAAMGFSLDEDAAYIVDEVRRHGTVTDLVVAEAWRGRGVGRLLLQEAERLTRAAGYKRLLIGALAANARARRIYEDFGFEPYVSILTKDL
ncbi:MAG: GNAT family N-acetyltransferase [Microvirga sp.]